MDTLGVWELISVGMHTCIRFSRFLRVFLNQFSTWEKVARTIQRVVVVVFFFFLKSSIFFFVEV